MGAFFRKLAFAAFFGVAAVASAGEAPQTQPLDPLAWPPITHDLRPWGYNWWMGSAVDAGDLSREMQRYHDAGLGGIHIIPIYGAKGAESRYVEYLSPKWMELLADELRDGQRLDMGVDMTTGTGWCFGGPQVSGDSAGLFATVVPASDPATRPANGAAGKQTEVRRKQQKVLRAVAVGADGRQVVLDLKDVAADGTVRQLPAGDGWRVFLLLGKPGVKVKRAAPGGEGPMINTVYAPAMDAFLEPFTKAFDAPGVALPRAMYHDSYEYHGGSPAAWGEWSPDFFEQFSKRRGYDLAEHLPELAGAGNADACARVRADYRETVSDLIAGEVFPRWVAWCHARGMLVRNQAHGSPTNLLDFYAIADIPETEVYRDKCNPLIAKFASSAAHVPGHLRASSETGTWLTEHWQTTLADLKREIDGLFVGGINHIFYHGTCYSPDDAAWPGWQFYASSEVNPRNAIWHDVPALNEYIARCQSILAAGRPDNDALLYWPIHDYWQSAPGLGLHLTMDNTDEWFTSQPIGATAGRLWKAGVGFDYVSDAMLANLTVENGQIKSPGGSYRLIVVPPTRFMPVPTLRRLLELADAGATVMFEGDLPQDVPGLVDLEPRRASEKDLLASLKFEVWEGTASRASTGAPTSGPSGVRIASVGMGRVVVANAGPALQVFLASVSVVPESLARHDGLVFIRRDLADGAAYFICNQSDQPIDDRITLSRMASSIVVMDPMTGRTGVADADFNPPSCPKLRLRLEAGQSIILRLLQRPVPDASPRWHFAAAGPVAASLNGPWDVHFVEGGPQLPKDYRLDQLASWTQNGDPEAERFAGTARYTIAFDAPAGDGPWVLDLGQVKESARVRLNGQDLGTLIAAPFQVPVASLRPAGNRLEIDVTNLSANRIRDLDRRKITWRIFNDINYASRDYGKFDASNWPVRESGLLGPVTICREQK